MSRQGRRAGLRLLPGAETVQPIVKAAMVAATLAMCIAVNTWQWPIVRQMAADIPSWEFSIRPKQTAVADARSPVPTADSPTPPTASEPTEPAGSQPGSSPYTGAAGSSPTAQPSGPTNIGISLDAHSSQKNFPHLGPSGSPFGQGPAQTPPPEAGPSTITPSDPRSFSPSGSPPPPEPAQTSRLPGISTMASLAPSPSGPASSGPVAQGYPGPQPLPTGALPGVVSREQLQAGLPLVPVEDGERNPSAPGNLPPSQQDPQAESRGLISPPLLVGHNRDSGGQEKASPADIGQDSTQPPSTGVCTGPTCVFEPGRPRIIQVRTYAGDEAVEAASQPEETIKRLPPVDSSESTASQGSGGVWPAGRQPLYPCTDAYPFPSGISSD